MFQQMGKMKKIIVQAPTLSASTTPTNCWAQVLSELLLTKQLKTGSPWQWSDLTRPLGEDVGFFCWYGKDHHRTQRRWCLNFGFMFMFMCFIQQFHKVSHFCFFSSGFSNFSKWGIPNSSHRYPGLQRCPCNTKRSARSHPRGHQTWRSALKRPKHEGKLRGWGWE